MTPLVKIGLAVGAAAGLFLLTSNSNAATPPKNNNLPPGPLPVPGGGRKTRPDVFPAGSGEARVIPNSQNGIRTRTGPGLNFPTLRPDGDPLLAYNNDTVAIVRMGIPEDTGSTDSKFGSEWWEVITPGGLRGFSRAVDRTGAAPVNNFTIVRAPAQTTPVTPVVQPAAIAGVYRPFAPSYGNSDAIGIKRRFRRPGVRIGAESSCAPSGQPFMMGQTISCRHPLGCWLRDAPSEDAGGIQLLNLNTPVVVDAYQEGPKLDPSSPSAGGWLRVHTIVSQVPMTGYVQSEWIA